MINPAEAAKKQARVWISQSINLAFETDILGSKKNAILSYCFPSRSKRLSGDHHTAKYLGCLGSLSFENEVFALQEIINQLEKKMAFVSYTYKGEKN